MTVVEESRPASGRSTRGSSESSPLVSGSRSGAEYAVLEAFARACERARRGQRFEHLGMGGDGRPEPRPQRPSPSGFRRGDRTTARPAPPVDHVMVVGIAGGMGPSKVGDLVYPRGRRRQGIRTRSTDRRLCTRSATRTPRHARRLRHDGSAGPNRSWPPGSSRGRRWRPPRSEASRRLRHAARGIRGARRRRLHRGRSCETAAVAGVCERRGVSWSAVRSISDSVGVTPGDVIELKAVVWTGTELFVIGGPGTPFTSAVAYAFDPRRRELAPARGSAEGVARRSAGRRLGREADRGRQLRHARRDLRPRDGHLDRAPVGAGPVLRIGAPAAVERRPERRRSWRRPSPCWTRTTGWTPLPYNTIPSLGDASPAPARVSGAGGRRRCAVRPRLAARARSRIVLGAVRSRPPRWHRPDSSRSRWRPSLRRPATCSTQLVSAATRHRRVRARLAQRTRRKLMRGDLNVRESQGDPNPAADGGPHERRDTDSVAPRCRGSVVAVLRERHRHVHRHVHRSGDGAGPRGSASFIFR